MVLSFIQLHLTSSLLFTLDPVISFFGNLTEFLVHSCHQLAICNLISIIWFKGNKKGSKLAKHEFKKNRLTWNMKSALLTPNISLLFDGEALHERNNCFYKRPNSMKRHWYRIIWLMKMDYLVNYKEAEELTPCKFYIIRLNTNWCYNRVLVYCK